MRISDWSSDVCSSDLLSERLFEHVGKTIDTNLHDAFAGGVEQQIGFATAVGGLVTQLQIQHIRGLALERAAEIGVEAGFDRVERDTGADRKSTRLNSSQ